MHQIQLAHFDAKAAMGWKYRQLVHHRPIQQDFWVGRLTPVLFCFFSYLSSSAGTYRTSGCWGSSCVPLKPDPPLRYTASFHLLVHPGNSAGNNRAWVWQTQTKGDFPFFFFNLRIKKFYKPAVFTWRTCQQSAWLYLWRLHLERAPRTQLEQED